MARGTSPSGILEWLMDHARPAVSDSATVRYERMEICAPPARPGIHLMPDAADPAHWQALGLVQDYLLSLAGARRILDVGPGDGWPALLLAPQVEEVVGIEPGPRRIAACRANAERLRLRNASFEQASACAMPFPDEHFDGAVAAFSLEQTPDPLAALREVQRVLRPGAPLRLSYEVVEEESEPVREGIEIRANDDGGFAIAYRIVERERARERGFLLEVRPANGERRERLARAAQRCGAHASVDRDPRLERGLAAAVTAIESREIVQARVFSLRHSRAAEWLRDLDAAGFVDARFVAGGGWPAQRIAEEMRRSQRIAATAPLLEELCRAAARIGVGLPTSRPGELFARKASSPRKRAAATPPRKRAQPASKRKAAAGASAGRTPAPSRRRPASGRR
ncbi:MAG: class I SAM-dependent methyltransferase [Candidatus Eisenbacteria bacterium]|nr:class I SAM-dependent methyltransferase [Candidatus Eisenbacteria bacterium]